MKSIEKLRESSHLDDDMWTFDDGVVMRMFGSDPCEPGAVNWGEQWRKIADEIEAEIAERYMLLPVDADGVPIQIGDLLESSEINKQFMCRGMSLALQSNEKWWTVEWNYDHYYGTSEYVSAKSCRHVNPDPLKELLDELVCDVRKEGYERSQLSDKAIADYAQRIREALKEGGE